MRRIAETLLRDADCLTHIVHEERAAHDGQVRGERRILTLSNLPEKNDSPLLRLPLLGQCLELDIASFFQVNTAAAQLLAGLAVHAVRGTLPADAAEALMPPTAPSPGSLLDLYCGAGAPGLLCVDTDAHLDGIEYDARATELAARNARALSRQARYLAGDAARLVRKLSADHEVILADPPRAGMDAQVIATLEQQKASRLIYISCNPATLARGRRAAEPLLDARSISAGRSFSAYAAPGVRQPLAAPGLKKNDTASTTGGPVRVSQRF